MTAPESPSLVTAMNDAVRFRTAAVLALVGATAVVNGIRLSTAGDQSASDVPMGVPIVMGLLVLYEAAVLVWLLRGRDRRKPLPTAWIYGNALLETAAPTALAFSVGLSDGIMLQGAAMGPSAHLYGIFIVLSVLHVRILVSFFAGVVSALGLAAVVAASIATEGEGASELLGIPRSLETFSAVILLITGAAAALVALRMRRYLRTATAEAERRMQAEQDLQAAALIQQSLMPSISPELAGFEIKGWNRPADETGGDYFDWVPLDDGRLAVCIADVTGHGLGPAMITCFCRAYARTSLRVEGRVAAAMSRLNSELVHDLGDGRFVTFAAVILSPEDPVVRSTSAGHGPLLVFRHSDRSIESFGADVLPLGVVETDEECEAITHRLGNGDVFLLVTDGFFEWANPAGEQYGTKRLSASLKAHGRKGGDDLIRSLLEDLEGFVQGTPQPDDLTAVVIRRTNAEDSGDPV
ncbi:MAG: PP2C family protein-serine/threonine phosphatase [Planctomycetota bacterium]